MDDVMVSILVPTYGQEKYIARTLDSILMQKTRYTQEILVGEDASPDGTRAILKEYEKKYPGRFTMIYRDVNMRQTDKSNIRDLRERAHGKYLITLEGDDFWLSEDKLEKQISFLEAHPEYIAAAHRCVVVGEDSQPNGERYPECIDSEYTLRHYLYNIMPGQLATVMTRNYIKYPLFDTSILEKKLSPGDRLLYFALITHGRIHCMPEQMSAYRHVKKNGTSFSANYSYTFGKEEHWAYELMKYAAGTGDKKAVKYTESVYVSNLIHALKLKKIGFSEFLKYYKNVKHKNTALYLCIRKIIFSKTTFRKMYKK